MDDLKSIRVFLEVAQRSSFAGAARALKLTPATVTRTVAKLEADLGQQLLVRTTRQVALTSAGALVASRYGPIVEDLDRATGELTRTSRPDRGKLSINAPISFGMRLLPELVESFALAYPNIALDVRMTDRLVDIINEECDLAIRISGPPSDKSTIWRKICEVPRRAVAAPKLFDRIPRPRTPEELDPAVCLSYSSSGQAETWEFRNQGMRRSIRAGTTVVSNNGDFLLGCVERGQGISVLPDFLVAPSIATGALIPVLEDWTLPSLWLTLYYPPYEAFPPLVATFTEFFEAFIAEQDGMLVS